jgi:hypothetical protein
MNRYIDSITSVERGSDHSCPLCCTSSTNCLFEIGERTYVECLTCDLLFCSPPTVLLVEQERQRYLSHQNSLEQEGYVRHLQRLSGQLIPLLEPESRGIDYGCGHTPVMSMLFASENFLMENYDPFFNFAPENANDTYHFLTCSETAEHFKAPREEFQKMKALIRTGGLMAIMTNLREGDRRTPSWWYLKDPTHTCFYSARTFQYIEDLCNCSIQSIKDDVVLLRAE